MTTVTRKVISKPSNSKSPGATHHIEISGKTFAAAAEQRGSGWATAIVDGETARLQVAATYLVGKQGRKERIVAEADVIVTGDDNDTLILASEYCSGQALVVEFRGVKAVSTAA